MRAGARAALAVLVLSSCAVEEGPRWLDLARVEATGGRLAGEVAPGVRVEREGEDAWLVARLERGEWRPGAEPGRFAATLPVLAVGQPSGGGAPYRLVAGGGAGGGSRAFAFESDLERFGEERGRFTVRAASGLLIQLALEEGEEPPERAELWAVLAIERADPAGARIGGRRLSGAGLWVASGAARTLALELPSDSRLSFATAVEPLMGARELRQAPHVFRVFLDGALLFQHRLEVGVLGEAIAWHALDLPRGGVQRAQLRFEVEGPLALTSILAPRVGPRERGSYGARPFPGARPPDLVVFLADTFRADNLAAYGGTLGLTPEIDRFAGAARTFARAWSTSTHTLPAHSSMFAGVYPHQLGQVDYYNALPGAVETLAELLAAHGYRCGAISDGVMVSRSHGLDQGFELFDERREVPTLERVRAFLDADDGRPIFLFVQTYAVHAPYAMSAETRARWQDVLRLDRSYAELEASELLRSQEYLPLGHEGPPEDPEAREIAARLRDLYRAGVADLDRTFGGFRAELEARGLLARGVLVFTSDHGEAFFEHGRPFHANRVFEEELRVPLILHAPGVAAGREERPVSLIDFAPTLAGLAGMPVPAHWRGRSLLDPAEERVLYAFQSQRLFPGSTLAVIDGERKLIGYETLEAVRAGRLHGAFDLSADPSERTSLHASESWPAELARAQAAELEELLTPIVEQEPLQATPDELEEMRRLGYAGASDDEAAREKDE